MRGGERRGEELRGGEGKIMHDQPNIFVRMYLEKYFKFYVMLI